MLVAFFVCVGLLFTSLPDVQVARQCFHTSMFNVYLCEKSPDYARLNEISPNLINAVIISEDASFRNHEGVDIEELKESFRRNLEEGKIKRGGSTITQQLVKNLFLTGEKSMFRKVKEIILATQMEREFSKNEILEKYLNVVEFGDGLFGVKKASQYYFKKSPSQLTPNEAAFLAFLLPNPHKYSQSFKKGQLTDFAKGMIKRILGRLYSVGRLDEAAYNQAIQSIPYFPWYSVPTFSNTEPAEVDDEPELKEELEEEGLPNW